MTDRGGRITVTVQRLLGQPLERQETEIKLRADDPRAVLASLQSLGSILCRKRHFEDNYLLDYRNGRIRRSGSLLRVRLTGRHAALTYKGPSRILHRVKARREVETTVADGVVLLTLLEELGLRTVFRYQKYRTIFQYGALLITLDETPIGNYFEIEGAPSRIESLAKRLGYGRNEFITKTYFELFTSYREANGIRSRDMVFSIRISK